MDDAGLGTTHNFERLKAHILPLSVAGDFSTARREWTLYAVEISEEWDHCPCSHEIKEHCFIRNRLNQNATHVGNVCINRFIGISTGNLFGGLKRIAKNASANANEDLIQHAYQLGYIFEGEYKFLMDTRLKRKLSAKQIAWKQKINRRIITQTVVQKRRVLEPLAKPEVAPLIDYDLYDDYEDDDVDLSPPSGP